MPHPRKTMETYDKTDWDAVPGHTSATKEIKRLPSLSYEKLMEYCVCQIKTNQLLTNQEFTPGKMKKAHEYFRIVYNSELMELTEQRAKVKHDSAELEELTRIRDLATEATAEIYNVLAKAKEGKKDVTILMETQQKFHFEKGAATAKSKYEKKIADLKKDAKKQQMAKSSANRELQNLKQAVCRRRARVVPKHPELWSDDESDGEDDSLHDLHSESLKPPVGPKFDLYTTEDMNAAIEEAKQTGEEKAQTTLFTAEQVQAAVDAAKVQATKEAFAMGFNEAWRTARLVQADHCPYDISDPKHPSQRAREVAGQAAPAVLKEVTGGLYKWTVEELTDPLDGYLEKPTVRSKYSLSQYYEDTLSALEDIMDPSAKDE